MGCQKGLSKLPLGAGAGMQGGGEGVQPIWPVWEAPVWPGHKSGATGTPASPRAPLMLWVLSMAQQ